MGNGDVLARAREASTRGRWTTAYEAYALAASLDRLEPGDLADWASAAMLSGRDDEGCDLLASAYDGLVRAGDVSRAARCVLWACLNLANRGRFAAVGAWMERGAGLAAEHPTSVVHGYLAVPQARRAILAGDGAGALEASRRALAVATEVGDGDLEALARLGEGHALLHLGETAAGLAALDGVMLATSSGGVSTLVVGIAYCAVVQLCREALDLRRAREWTTALDGWCDRQPELVPFRGECRIGRSQVLLDGDDWDRALAEAERAVAALSDPRQASLGAAWYQLGEVHRLRGELDAAQDAYRAAHESGADPMPGLALVWAVGPRAGDAHEALTARLDGPAPPSSGMLAAVVEVALAAGDVDAAGRSADVLAARAAGPGGGLCADALARAAQGAVLLARREPFAALEPLTWAADCWLRLEIPYQVARVRIALASAHAVLGDDVEAGLLLDAARATFRRLGASSDLARATRDVSPPDPDGTPLTAREVQVLRLVATGCTNRAVATALSLSERTVARHVSNIFVKLDVPSRAAATAWAYEHGVVGPGPV